MFPIYITADSSVTVSECDAICDGVKEMAKLFNCIIICALQQDMDLGAFFSADEIIRTAPRVEQGKVDTKTALTTMGEIVKKFDRPGAVIMFTGYDLVANGTWCFGVARASNKCSIQSTLRYRGLSDDLKAKCIKRTLRHELGHIFNCASDIHRSNTVDRFGVHCINYGCSMRQVMNLQDLISAVGEEDSQRCFCNQCMDDMRRFSKRYEGSNRSFTALDVLLL